MSTRLHLLALGLVGASALSLFSACGSSASDDARCVSLCAVEDAKFGDVCSQASADACREECGARIMGTTAPCGSCLLEDAYFGAGATGGGGGEDCFEPSDKCPGAECTMEGPSGSCNYCDGDTAAQQDCYEKLNPRQEVACKVEFRDPAKCSALCVEK